jgi:hypothetical protein
MPVAVSDRGSDELSSAKHDQALECCLKRQPISKGLPHRAPAVHPAITLASRQSLCTPLAKLAHRSYGPFALGVVAAGLIVFAFYSLSDARYHRI